MSVTVKTSKATKHVTLNGLKFKSKFETQNLLYEIYTCHPKSKAYFSGIWTALYTPSVPPCFYTHGDWTLHTLPNLQEHCSHNVTVTPLNLSRGFQTWTEVTWDSVYVDFKFEISPIAFDFSIVVAILLKFVVVLLKNQKDDESWAGPHVLWWASPFYRTA